MYAGFREETREFVCVAALVIVVPQSGDDGNGAIIEGFEKRLRLFRSTEVGEVSSYHEHVRVPCGPLREGAEALGVSHAGVEVSGGRDLHGHLTPPPRPKVAPPWPPRARWASPTPPRPRRSRLRRASSRGNGDPEGLLPSRSAPRGPPEPGAAGSGCGSGTRRRRGGGRREKTPNCRLFFRGYGPSRGARTWRIRGEAHRPHRSGPSQPRISSRGSSPRPG